MYLLYRGEIIGMKEILSKAIYFLAVLFFSYGGQTMLKKGISKIGVIDLSIFLSFAGIYKLVTNKFLVLGAVMCVCGAALWLTVLSRFELSKALPILGSIGFLLIPISSFLFLQESLSPLKIGGTLLITIGMICVANS
jgi:drug/metabolite transporter (DMT)-like permease